MRSIERARPLLGTIVAVRAEGHGDPASAVEAAFAAVARVERRMSAYREDGDLAAVARLRAGERAAVDPLTARCLWLALALARASEGVFDPVVATARRGGGAGGQAGPCWRDVALGRGGVTVRRALRLDLGGVAKGFAVDRAVAALRRAGVASGAVDAGGDLRLFGADDWVALAPSHAAPPAAIRLGDGALASSDVAAATADRGAPQHRHPATGTALAPGFASVAASRCAVADALTKIVLARGAAAAPLLARLGARGFLHRPGGDWQEIAA
ncbi:FAD:protein FMN transferase [Sphingomonas sp. BK235]|uniref:FAD:protein FMN transferase n=1 Tax=Sphingomonas sp. BK235 TaxID=2512131 RepID=UPI0010D0BA7C|nr:FAD:protein FMN transferase [Sphingomonas sp. BK235]TCP35969.1 thiamine biosynthesis lipoprotein [Sphingomonas sp. BK235]